MSLLTLIIFGVCFGGVLFGIIVYPDIFKWYVDRIFNDEDDKRKNKSKKAR